MMGESTPRKIWNVIYPVLALFVFYFAVVYGGMLIFSSTSCAASGTLDDYMGKYFSIIVAVALVIIFIVEYIFYKNDYVVPSRFLYRKPVCFLPILLLGAAASHGLNLLVSLLPLNGILGDYAAVESEIYAPGVVFVILRAIILAPLAEELVFRGLVFRRLENYTNFWVGAIVSAALFGFYHLNLMQGIYAFLFGILLAYVYKVFRNLWAPIVLHAGANLLSVILEYTRASYPSMGLYIGSIIVMLVLTVLGCVYLQKKVLIQRETFDRT